MKHNKFVNNLGTAGLVAAVAFTMFSCANKKQPAEYDVQSVINKTDSAVNNNPEYKIASGLVDLCNRKKQRFRRINKDVMKVYSRDYIKNNIDSVDASLMLNALEQECLVLGTQDIFMDDIKVFDNFRIKRVYKEQKWFYALMLYLTDQYDEKQFLNSEFFTVMDSLYLKKCCEKTEKQVEILEEKANSMLDCKTEIYSQFFDKYSKIAQNQR